MTKEIIDKITEMYEGTLDRPNPCSIFINPEMAKAAGWEEGQLLTKYDIPVVFDNTIFLGNKTSDIQIGNKPIIHS